MTMAAIGIGGAVLGAGASIYGSNQQSKAASDAADAQAQGTLQGQLAAQNAANQANRWLKPYRNSGEEAISQLNYLMGLGDPEAMATTQANFDEQKYRDWLISRKKARLEELYKNPDKIQRKLDKATARLDKDLATNGAWKNYQSRKQAGQNIEGDFWKKRSGLGGADGGQGGLADNSYGQLMQRFNNQLFEKDPGYQFRMDEGAKAVDASAAARNGLLSGAAMKAMQRYGQGYASNEYANAYNRFTNDQNNRFNRLQNMTDTGMRAAGAAGANTMTAGSQANQSFNDLGAIRASGVMGAANARSSGYSQLGNTLMDVGAMYYMNKNKNGGWAGSGYNDGMQYDLGQ